ncbi:hypothetical protein GBAR_LOCUS21182, partial [Geodia barretti]
MFQVQPSAPPRSLASTSLLTVVADNKNLTCSFSRRPSTALYHCSAVTTATWASPSFEISS